MGGVGSGGHRWGKHRIPVEKCLVLDFNQLAREGLLTAPHSVVIRWAQTAVAAAAFRPESHELMIALELDGEIIDRCLSLSATECRFGGSRLWMHCPRCGERVCKLYLPYGGAMRLRHEIGFACRRCWGLTYDSRNTKDQFEKAFRRQGKIKARFGGMRSSLGEFPSKPKWMRNRTYQRLTEKLVAERLKSNQAMITSFAKRFPEIIRNFTRAEGEP